MDDGRALIARGVVQRFGGALALDHVDFEVTSGEIHALLGENGAGKSTLVKVLTGALIPDDGEVLIDGESHRMRSPRHAQELGIGVVYQDFHLFPHLTVAENIFAAAPHIPNRGGFTARRRIRSEAHELLASFGIDVDPRRLAGELDAAERKLVEISRALLLSPKYLFLDEPTAALEPRETVRLLGVVRRLAERGTGIILVTHRLGEVVEVADRATALRNGRNAGTLEREEFSLESLAELIVGQEVAVEEGPRHTPIGTALRVSGLRLREDSRPVEVSVGTGELVAVIGLIGSGVSALMNTACGATASKTAEIEVNGVTRHFRSRRVAQGLGIGAVPVDRKASGLILETSVAKNVGLASLGDFSRLGFTSRGRLRTAARESQRVFDIRLQSVDQPVKSLSGGNQQKVMLVFDEPTRGIDVGAKAEIYKLLQGLAEQGKAIVVISSELPEVLRLSHRILVMAEGRITGELDGRTATQEAIMTLATHRSANAA